MKQPKADSKAESLPKRLRTARLVLRKTQADFARSVSVSISYYSAIENSKRNLPAEMLEELCEIWGINIKWLETGEGQMLTRPGEIGPKYWPARETIYTPLAPLEEDHLPERIKAVRKGKKLTQGEFAEALGISKIYVCSMEHRKCGVSNALLESIVRTFHISFNWLWTGQGEMTETTETTGETNEPGEEDIEAELAIITDYLRGKDSLRKSFFEWIKTIKREEKPK